jgi:putative RecB family exonuclease
VSDLAALSYSSVRTYLECPQRWKYLYVDKLSEAPKGYFSFGRTVHAVLEEFVRPLLVPFPRVTPAGQTQSTLDQYGEVTPIGASVVPMGQEALLATYERLWISEGYSSPEEERRYRTLGADLLLRYREAFVASPPVPIAVEEHLEARWAGISVHGYIDRIDRTPSGGLEVLDYKTGRGLNRSHAVESDQLSFYQVLVEHNFPAKVESLALFDLRGNTAWRVPSRSKLELEPVHGRLSSVADGIRAESYEPNPTRFCARCEFRSICPEFKEVPRGERERITGLVDRFVELRRQGDRLDRELRKVAEELHAEAERLGLRRLPGTESAALRRREEKWSFSPEAVRPLLEKTPHLERVSRPDPARLEHLLSDPTVDPALRKALAARGGRSVRWFWEVDSVSGEPAVRG